MAGQERAVHVGDISAPPRSRRAPRRGKVGREGAERGPVGFGPVPS